MQGGNTIMKRRLDNGDDLLILDLSRPQSFFNLMQSSLVVTLINCLRDFLVATINPGFAKCLIRCSILIVQCIGSDIIHVT